MLAPALSLVLAVGTAPPTDLRAEYRAAIQAEFERSEQAEGSFCEIFVTDEVRPLEAFHAQHGEDALPLYRAVVDELLATPRSARTELESYTLAQTVWQMCRLKAPAARRLCLRAARADVPRPLALAVLADFATRAPSTCSTLLGPTLLEWTRQGSTDDEAYEQVRALARDCGRQGLPWIRALARVYGTPKLKQMAGAWAAAVRHPEECGLSFEATNEDGERICAYVCVRPPWEGQFKSRGSCSKTVRASRL